MRVDLPAPFWPSRQWTSPARISRSTPSSARAPGNCFTMPRICSSWRVFRWVRIDHGQERRTTSVVGQAKVATSVAQLHERDLQKAEWFTVRMDELLKFAPRPTGAGEMFQLLRDRQPRTRSDLATLTGQARSTIAARVDLLLVLRVRRAGRRGHLDRRTPARHLRVQPRRARRAGRRPRRHALAPRADRPGRARCWPSTTSPIAIAEGPGPVLDRVVELGLELLEHRRTPAQRPGQRRRRPARPRRALDRAADQPADHARLGRRRRARAPRPASCASPSSWTTTSTSWPSASTRRSGPRSTTCCSSRSRPASAPGSSPTARSAAAPRVRPATSATSPSPAGSTCRAAAATPAASRRSPAGRPSPNALAERRPTSADVVALVRAGDLDASREVAGRRPAHRRGPRRVREHAEPVGHRHRRRRGRGRGAPARRHPRGRLPPVAAAGHAAPAHRRVPDQGPRRRARARARWPPSTCCPPPPSTP